MTETTITLRLIVADPVPGVRYSLQDQKSVPVEPRTAGEGPLVLDVPVRLHPDGRLTGPFVRREGPERRFVYIAIGTAAGDCGSAGSRRAKIDVHDIPAALLDQARAGRVLAADLPGRDRHGCPACATVRPLDGWRAL